VGRYALGVDWEDGHGSIFPFEHLRRACPCEACTSAGPAAAVETRPREIARLPDAVKITWVDGHETLHPHPALRALCGCASCTGGH
jgi:DUF971 family protein